VGTKNQGTHSIHPTTPNISDQLEGPRNMINNGKGDFAKWMAPYRQLR
jgi:hypothetical protein